MSKPNPKKTSVPASEMRNDRIYVDDKGLLHRKISASIEVYISGKWQPLKLDYHSYAELTLSEY